MSGTCPAGEWRRLRREAEVPRDRGSIDLEVERRPDLEPGLERVPSAHVRERIDELMLLNRKLPALMGGRAERRNAGDCKPREGLVGYAAQSNLGRPAPPSPGDCSWLIRLPYVYRRSLTIARPKVRV